MKIDPTGKYNEDVFFVLHKIKRRSFYDKDDNGIINYTIKLSPVAGRTLDPMDEHNIIEKLIKKGVVKEVKPSERQVGEVEGYTPVITMFHFLKLNEKKFNELFAKYEKLCGFEPSIFSPIIGNWELDVEKGTVSKKGKVLYKFPTTWSQKFRYFKCLWNKHGEKVGHKELFEYENELKYPSKGDVWKVNKAISKELRKLKKQMEDESAPLDISISKGATLHLS